MTTLRATCTLFAGAALLLSAGCRPSSRHAFSGVSLRQLTYDDMCHLQDYFDQRNAAHIGGFVAEAESISESTRTVEEEGRTQRVSIGEGTYVVTDRRARRRLAQLLDDEYTGVRDVGVRERGASVRLAVHWFSTATARRLDPAFEVVLRGPSGSVELPYNVCVGEFLFGAEVYAMRRRFFDDDAARARGETPGLDAGADAAAAVSVDAATDAAPETSIHAATESRSDAATDGARVQ